MPDPIRMTVVGVGALGRHHARILNEMDGVDLVAVCDPNEAQGRAVANACNTEWTNDYRTLLGLVDAASIVVPTSLHRKVAGEFLLRSVPLLIEKPLAATVEDGSYLVSLADEHNVPLQVGHIERFNPTYQELTRRVQSPKYIRSERLSPYAFRCLDVGVVHDVMIHDIELILNLVQSPVRSVEAFGACLFGGNEDTAQARLRFENGCIADIVANRISPDPKRTMQVWSAAGCVNADFQTRELVHHKPGPALLAGRLPCEMASQSGADIAKLKEQIFTTFLTTETPKIPATDQLTDELQSFVTAVRTKSTPFVDGAQGLVALQVAEQVLTAIDEHAWDGTSTLTGPHAHMRTDCETKIRAA